MINPNQIQSYETWQEAFDGVKRAVDEYHTKFWEELEKMTKIDETKQYKFSEIIAMLENKELPEGTKVVSVGNDPNKCIVKSTLGGDLNLYHYLESTMPIAMFSHYFRKGWTIKLPKEDKYYLKAPKGFNSDYLNLNSHTGSYFLAGTGYGNNYQTQFTQSEISAMPFKTSFFEKIKVEDEK